MHYLPAKFDYITCINLYRKIFTYQKIKLYRLPNLRIRMRRLVRARKRFNTLGCLRKFDIQSARPRLALSRRALRERETLWIRRRCFTHGRMSLRAPRRRRPLDFEFVSDLYSSRHRHRRRRRRRRECSPGGPSRVQTRPHSITRTVSPSSARARTSALEQPASIYLAAAVDRENVVDLSNDKSTVDSLSTESHSRSETLC